jgi:hypothetical protein
MLITINHHQPPLITGHQMSSTPWCRDWPPRRALWSTARRRRAARPAPPGKNEGPKGVISGNGGIDRMGVDIYIYIHIYIYIWIYVDLCGFMWIYVDWLVGIDYMDLRSAPICIYICWDHQNNSPLTSRSLAKRGSWRDQVVGMCGQLVSGIDGCKGCKQPETMGIGWWDMMGMAWFG